MSKVFIHPTAVLEDGATVGEYTNIWHFSHIQSAAKIGENCNLGQNTFVANDALIGNACRLGNSVSIYSHVELEDFVFCAPFMVFTHINYPRAAINRRNVFQKTLVKTGATLGANSTVLPNIIVGQGAFVGAGSVLTKSCKDWALMVGIPAKHLGWVSAFGEKIPLPLQGSGSWVCPHTNDVYYLMNKELIRLAGSVDILKYTHGKKLNRKFYEDRNTNL